MRVLSQMHLLTLEAHTIASYSSVAALACIASVNLASLASILSVTILSVTLASGAAVPARADLIICNQSDEDVSIATMYHRSSNDAWTANGWANLDDNECNHRLTFDLNETVYFHARVGGINGRTTHPVSGSTTSFCVDTEDPFEILWDGDNTNPWYKDLKLSGGFEDPFEILWDGDNTNPWYKDLRLSGGFERCENLHSDYVEVPFYEIPQSKNNDHCVVALGNNGSFSWVCFN